MKKDFGTVLFSVFFIVFGGIFFAAGAFILKSNLDFKKDAVIVNAEIVDIESYRDRDGDRHYTVYVSYSIGGEYYSYVSLDSYTAGMHVGKMIDVYVNPSSPSQAKSAGDIYLFPAVFVLMGGVVMTIGMVVAIRAMKQGRKYKRLLTTGKPLQAVVDRIDLNHSYSVNGAHPFILYCSYTDEYQNMTYRFKSDNLWENPEPVLPPGSTVKVLVDPSDYSRYYVCAKEAMSVYVTDYTNASY